jgi:hypothetical protein
VARKLIVEVAADISQYLKGLEQSAKATSTLDVQVKELNVSTTKLAQTQVAAPRTGRSPPPPREAVGSRSPQHGSPPRRNEN